MFSFFMDILLYINNIKYSRKSFLYAIVLFFIFYGTIEKICIINSNGYNVFLSYLIDIVIILYVFSYSSIIIYSVNKIV